MTFLEAKLLSYFRACDDDRKAAILESAQLLSSSAGSVDLAPASGTVPDPDSVQTSIAGEKMMRIAHKAEIPVRYQMVMPELRFLHELTIRDGNEFNALCFAFDYGFVKGNRATRRGRVKAL